MRNGIFHRKMRSAEQQKSRGELINTAEAMILKSSSPASKVSD